MDWLHDTQWLFWLAAALAAGVVEILTVDFVFLMIAGGALVAGVAAGFDAPVPLQVILFAASSGAFLLAARPPLKRWVANTPAIAMNVAALAGRGAKVLETVTDRSGRVKLAGEVWSARAAPGEKQLEVGSDVHVVRIDGATAVVASDHVPPETHSSEGGPTP
jgi:membrane protein implicated in regulation of membrane protease activity